jgi:hypothetical protein
MTLCVFIGVAVTENEVIDMQETSALAGAYRSETAQLGTSRDLISTWFVTDCGTQEGKSLAIPLIPPATIPIDIRASVCVEAGCSKVALAVFKGARPDQCEQE